MATKWKCTENSNDRELQRQAWCHLQVKLCDSFLSVLSVPPWPKKRNINTLPFHSFPFLKTLPLADPLIASNQAFWIGLCVRQNSSRMNAHAEYTDDTDRHTQTAASEKKHGRYTYSTRTWSASELTRWCLRNEFTGGVYTVSQKIVPLLQLAIIFTYTVRLRQFLAHILPRKYAIKTYFIFPPHLTSASTLPGETGNPEIASFRLNAACFFTKKTRNTVKNITWSELNHPSLSKRSSWSTRQDLGSENSILLSVTHTLCVSQVCHAVSRCVKHGSSSSSSLE